MTITDKLCVEQRRAPPMPGGSGRRMRRTHDPSRFRGGGDGRSRNPQQKAGDPCSLRGERQLAARHQIELLRLAPDFQHHGADRIAGKRVGRGAQGALDIARAHRHQMARIEAELDQSAHRQRARFALGKILPHPDQRPARRHAPGKTCDKSGGRGTLPAAFTQHLLHCADREPALQHGIGARMAERGALRHACAALCLDTFDAAAQTRKRAHACACHGVASFKRGVGRH